MRTLILTLVGLSTLGELAALAAPPSLRRHHKHLAPIQHPSLEYEAATRHRSRPASTRSSLLKY